MIRRNLLIIGLFMLGGLLSAEVGDQEVRVRHRFFRGSVSMRNLLDRSPYRKENNRLFRMLDDRLSSIPDELRILALRVEFQLDENDSTSGDGRFDMSVPDEPLIDPPPHDRVYFENQMAALANYYEKVSGENLTLQCDVAPDIYTLPREMKAYHHGDDDEMNHELAALFRDAVLAADAEGVLFSGYDCFVVFHAGVGGDFLLDYDPTPYDIPSAFLSLQDLSESLADGDPGYLGLEVENGQFHVPEGIVLPETQSQEDFEFGLLGTMTLMFGFQLGMPALWNTDSGDSGIGRWGLMDQGSGNFNGLIPAEPCAWNKVFLGWEDPEEIRQGNTLQIACSQAAGSDKIYKVPVNDHEYFLIENRQYDFNGDSMAVGIDADSADVVFLPDGSVEITQTGVIVSVDEYDYGLPGSGILIWHVDESVILAEYAENRVNADPDHRGIDLEEADGAQDIGESYDYTSAGYGAEYGVYHDAWFADNEINLLVNSADAVAFTPASFPASLSNSGGNSHIVIDGFSENGPVMTFSVHSDLLQDGFPTMFGASFGTPYAPLFGDVDGDGETEIIVATDAGFLLGWKSDGTMIGDEEVQGVAIGVSGDSIRIPVTLIGQSEDGFSCSPAIGLSTGGNRDIICTGAETGRILIWTEENGSFAASTLYACEGTPVTALMLLDDQVVFGTEGDLVMGLGYPQESAWQAEFEGTITGLCEIASGGSQYVLATTGEGWAGSIDPADGETTWESRLLSESLGPPSAAGFTGEEVSFAAIAGDGSGHVFDQAGEETASFSEHSLTDSSCSAAVADLDGDGFVEIVTTGSGKIQVYNDNGSPADYFPVPRYDRDVALSSPVLGDINGDGTVDIVVATGEGNVEAWQTDGSSVDGFPLSTGASLPVTPTLLDLDGDEDIEIAAVTDRGYLFVWDLSGTYSAESVPWGHWRHDPALTGLNTLDSDPPEVDVNWSDKMTCYNYPNPAQGGFTTIRYYLELFSDVSITIYDLAGEVVDSFSGPGIGQAENEVDWDLSGVESGVYFCRVKAESGGIEKTAICKIAVAK